MKAKKEKDQKKLEAQLKAEKEQREDLLKQKEELNKVLFTFNKF